MSKNEALDIVRDGEECWCTCDHELVGCGHSSDCMYLQALGTLAQGKWGKRYIERYIQL